MSQLADDAAPNEPDAPYAGYDDIADGYARHWGPVIRPGALPVLDLLGAAMDGRGEAHVLDLGAGTGALAIAALERWPVMRVSALDPSSEMLGLAERHAREVLGAAGLERLALRVGAAEALPWPAGTFDHAVSSFVVQLLDRRRAALEEVRRVLRPGGTFSWVAWLRGGGAFEPDRVVNEVLDEAGFDPPEDGGPSGDLVSVTAAAQSMRRAGFRNVTARASEVVHRWDAERYLAFFTQFDEASLFDDLEPDERAEIESQALARLRALPGDAFVLRMPVVYVTGAAPAR